MKKEQDLATEGLVKNAARIKAPQILAQARIIYDEARTTAELGVDAAVGAEKKRLYEKLSEMVIELTKKGRLEDAVAVRTFAEKLNSGVISRVAPALSSSSKPLTLRVQVDGSTHLFIKGDLLWFDHRDGKAKAPGRHQGEFPTFINDTVEWMPVWTGKVNEPYDVGVGLADSIASPLLKAEVLEGRRVVDVIELPSPQNDFTAKLSLRDENKSGKTFFGSEWITFTLTW